MGQSRLKLSGNGNECKPLAQGAIMEVRSAANPKGSSPSKHGVGNLLDLSADTWWAGAYIRPLFSST